MTEKQAMGAFFSFRFSPIYKLIIQPYHHSSRACERSK
jgi:hypothetical protein